MAEKTVKVKQPQPENSRADKPRLEKPRLFQKARTTDKEKDKDHDKVSHPNRFVKWYRETIGELRKVSWPTPTDAWRLTKIVLIVMTIMSILLYLFDFLFSNLISLLVA